MPKALERRKADSLTSLRTAGLSAMLVVIFGAAIAMVYGLVALGGYALIENGAATMDQLTSPMSIFVVLLLGNVVLAAIVCAAVNHTFVQPLRRMTLGMKQLAKGNFSFRMQRHSRVCIREVLEFAESFNITAAELASTEMMRAGFISDFSHEFRTPITSISGFAQLLAEDGLTDEERHVYTSIIVEESQRLAGLSERILLLSKIEATTILPDTEAMDIAEQLRHTVALFDARLSEKGLTVDLNLDACTVPGNADYLAQLWTNLFDNAVKFSPDGGRVRVALYGGGREGRAGEEAVVQVSDEGCGMDGDTQARIFERFYQGDASRAPAGAGLGLALCRRIVELHGGSISVQSAPGKGSSFEVRLPLSPQAAKVRSHHAG